MACCGTRVIKNKKRILPQNTVVSSSTDYNYVTVTYLGELTLKVVGCYTKSRYLFASGITRSIEENDARCLFDLMPGIFIEQVVEDNATIPSDYTESEYQFSESQSEID